MPSGQLVLASKAQAQFNLSDEYEFYQAATIGGNNGLRGYRNERFSGKRAFYQSTDLRFNFKRYKTSVIPIEVGIYGGFDYGKVWVDGDDSDKWNNSYGGGIFANMLNMMSLNLSAFNSNDGLRLAFNSRIAFS